MVVVRTASKCVLGGMGVGAGEKCQESGTEGRRRRGQHKQGLWYPNPHFQFGHNIDIFNGELLGTGNHLLIYFTVLTTCERLLL